MSQYLDAGGLEYYNDKIMDVIEAGDNKSIDKTNLSLDVQAALDQSSSSIQEIFRMIQKTNNGISKAETEILQNKLVLQTLTDADVINSENVVVDSFKTINDITIIEGGYDSVNNRLYA